mmetsp:Transcript_37533/g.94368  ORF Transcript_37533/g.94368 Transcript_37533/m.94368 type:complete len:378 (-) Transcript_37533:2113-3246(-)
MRRSELDGARREGHRAMLVSAVLVVVVAARVLAGMASGAGPLVREQRDLFDVQCGRAGGRCCWCRRWCDQRRDGTLMRVRVLRKQCNLFAEDIHNRWEERSFSWIGGPTGSDQCLTTQGHVGGKNRSRLFGDNSQYDLSRVPIRVRFQSGQQFVETDTKAKHIRLLTIRFTLEHLGCSPGGGAAHSHVISGLCLDTCQAKVTNLELPGLVDQQVERFEVTMQHRWIQRVQVLHAERCLQRHAQTSTFRHTLREGQESSSRRCGGSRSVFTVPLLLLVRVLELCVPVVSCVDDLVQVATIHPLGDHGELGRLGGGAVEVYDAGMVQLAHETGLLDKVVHQLLVAAHAREEHLHRHRYVLPHGKVHLAVGAKAHPALQL